MLWPDAGSGPALAACAVSPWQPTAEAAVFWTEVWQCTPIVHVWRTERGRGGGKKDKQVCFTLSFLNISQKEFTRWAVLFRCQLSALGEGDSDNCQRLKELRLGGDKNLKKSKKKKIQFDTVLELIWKEKKNNTNFNQTNLHINTRPWLICDLV